MWHLWRRDLCPREIPRSIRLVHLFASCQENAEYSVHFSSTFAYILYMMPLFLTSSAVGLQRAHHTYNTYATEYSGSIDTVTVFVPTGRLHDG